MGKRYKDDFAEKKYSKPIKNRLSEHQLLALNEEIEGGYMQDKEVSFPSPAKIRVFDELQWLTDKGAMKNGAVVISNFSPAEYNGNGTLVKGCDCEPILYEQLCEDIKQWRNWKGRKEYGVKMREENSLTNWADEIAEKMKL